MSQSDASESNREIRELHKLVRKRPKRPGKVRWNELLPGFAFYFHDEADGKLNQPCEVAEAPRKRETQGWAAYFTGGGHEVRLSHIGWVALSALGIEPYNTVEGQFWSGSRYCTHRPLT